MSRDNILLEIDPLYRVNGKWKYLLEGELVRVYYNKSISMGDSTGKWKIVIKKNVLKLIS